jgi:hypothetical protein
MKKTIQGLIAFLSLVTLASADVTSPINPVVKSGVAINGSPSGS